MAPNHQEIREGLLHHGEGGLTARYVRVKVLPKGHPQAIDGWWDGLSRTNPPSVQIPNAISITSRSVSDRSHDPIGRCIYCRALESVPGSGERLHEEHILAEGLGGTLILREASCVECENKIKQSEGKILRTSLFAPRARLIRHLFLDLVACWPTKNPSLRDLSSFYINPASGLDGSA